MKRPRPDTPRASASVPRTPAELEIEAVAAQGDGVTSNGLFVPWTLPGERVSAIIDGERGALQTVLRASPDRQEPPCPHFGACGGCALQHWRHPPYLDWKVEQIRLSLARVGLETEFAVPFTAPRGARRRLALHARRRDGRVALGFKARRSWSLIPISVCPISESTLVAALPGLARLAEPLFEHAKSAPILHVTLTETGLDVDITGVEARSGGLSANARLRLAEAARAADIARATLAGEILFQARAPLVRFGRATVALPPGGFLQAVKAAEAAMAAFAGEALAGCTRLADLFCGAGAFTFPLAEGAAVQAYDGSEAAVRALSAGVATAPGLKPIAAEARDLFRRPLLAGEMKRLEGVLFDPPRAGALEQAREIAASKVGVAVGVSCNPATFARDAAVLIAGGFGLKRVLPVDQFLWSPHIELVGVFTR